MNKYSYIIVDDTEIDRLTTSAFLSNSTFLEQKGSFSTPLEAIEYLKSKKIDVVFLDIDMPEMSGIDFMKSIENSPVCIFITSHPEFALEGFELDALDYILKPIQKTRFETCMKRLEDYLEITYKSKLFDISYGDSMIVVKDGYSQTKVNLQEIIYLEALKDYTRLITKDKKYTVRGTIGNLLETEHFQKFIRIHKSYAIQKLFVQQIKNDCVHINEELLLPIGRKYKENLSLLL